MIGSTAHWKHNNREGVTHQMFEWVRNVDVEFSKVSV